jgi:CheY-like chemotaxis protein
LIWIEDQPSTLSAAQGELEDRGWNVTFEGDIVAAATALSERTYDALIMDLMVAGGPGGVRQGFAIWATYRLLCWLRGAPPDANRGVASQWTDIDSLTPVDGNRMIPAMILSAYHEPEVKAALGVVDRTRLDREIRCFAKPLHAERIADELIALVAADRRP